MSRENSLQPLVTLYCASKPTVSAQIAKYPNLFILGLSQDGKNGLCQFSDIRKMTQGLEQSHLNRCGYHLRKMVYEKQDRGLFVAILRFCHITINYLHFFAQTGGITYYAKLIDITLNKLGKLITTISHSTNRP